MTSVYELKIGAEKLEVLLAIGEELTTLANTLNAAKEKLSQIANGNDDALKSLAELKKEILAEQEKINAILSAANEQAAQTLSAAQSQAEQTAKLAKEATEQNAASAKSAQQKAAEILASIEKLQGQIKSTANKVENAGALLTELNSLKEQIKTLLQSGIINDEAQSATQTYSSNLIERKLETKASVGYGYSKIEANAKFETLAQGITTAISAAAAAKSSADSKLGKDEQAADSAKLGGSPASDYALKTQTNTLETKLADKLGKSDRAADSAKLGGIAADKYAQKTDISVGVEAATEAKAGIVKLKNSITGSLSDTAVSENAVKEYVGKSAGLGIGQSWQDVTAQRQIGVTYTNTTGRPIALSVTLQAGSLGGAADIKLSVNGQIVCFQYVGGMNASPSISAFWILRAGDTYSLTAQSSGNLIKWLELR